MDFPAHPFRMLRYALLLLVVTTVALLAWHHFGMDRVLTLDPAQHTIRTHDDRTEGGHSIASVTRTGRALALRCDMLKGYQWPFCELSYALGKAAAGVDLSGFDSVRFKVTYSGPPPHAVRFFLRNFEPPVSKLEQHQTLKVNEVEFEVPPDGEIEVPMRLFRVASWWAAEMKLPLRHSDMRIDNVVFAEVSTGSFAVPGLHRVEVESIEFRGKWVSRAQLLTGLIAAWLLFGASWLLVELVQLRASWRETRARIARLQSINEALQIEAQELAGQARIDPLTGALNRQGLRDFLLKQWHGDIPIGPSLCVVFADLDRFKQINDSQGHAVGDEVLRQFAYLVQGEIRSTDRLARWGGEEFLIVCPETTLLQGRVLAEKLRASIEQRAWPRGLKVTCSFGVAAHADGDDFGTMIQRADAALYQAKACGRNRVEADGVPLETTPEQEPETV